MQLSFKKKTKESGKARPPKKTTTLAAFAALPDDDEDEIAEQRDDKQVKSVVALRARGDALASRGAFKHAVSAWSNALAICDDVHVASRLEEQTAQAWLELDEPFKGVLAAARAAELAPRWAQAAHTLARCQRNFGELPMALESLRRARSLTHDDDAASIAAIDDDVADVEALLATHEARGANEAVASRWDELPPPTSTAAASIGDDQSRALTAHVPRNDDEIKIDDDVVDDHIPALD
jgi:hypothetical protein